MAASVRIEDEAFSDSRYAELAEYAGLVDADHALAKMARLWRQCTIEQSHCLSEVVVRMHLGSGGVDALVRARLGVSLGDGRVRIRGTKGRIEWLRALRENGKKGGRPRRVTKKPSGFQDGNPSGSGELNPPAPAPAPAPAQEECAAPAERTPPLPLTLDPPKPPKERKPKSAALAPGDHRTITDAYFERYEAKYGSRPTWGAKQGAMVNALLKSHAAAEVVRRLGILFTSPPTWLEGPYDFGTLVTHFDKLVQTTEQAKAAPRFAAIPIAPSSRRDS